MQWVALTDSWDLLYYNGSQPGIWDQPPERGSLPARQAQHLAAVLEQFTTTADECYYPVCLARTMVLLLADTATVSMASAPFEQSLSLWWPSRPRLVRRVATDIDLGSSWQRGDFDHE
jgi:hypothetical protein